MKNRITVIGDLMLDKYDFCVNRDNPESSAPCYRVTRTEYRPGGAGNVAANLSTLGSDVKLIGVVGNDENSIRLKKVLDKFRIKHCLISDLGRPTIVKERIMSEVDNRYHFRKDIEREDEIEKNHVEEILKNIGETDLIIVSDYNKGNITQKLMDSLKNLRVKIVADPKPVHKNFYKDVFLIKPNSEEVKDMSDSDDEIKASIELGNYLKTNVLLTRGQNGLSYFGLDGKRVNLPAHSKDVFDVTGAGDTVVATFSHFYLKGFSIEKCLEYANIAAGIAVEYPGCYQVSEEEIFNSQV